jgi:FkbM family methyltransferase
MNEFTWIKYLRKIKWKLERSYGERAINYRNRGQINLIDVGALGWLPFPWKKWKNTSRIKHLLRFEPQETNHTHKNITTIDTALWFEDCQRDFYIFSDHGGGASLFQQNYAYVKEHFDQLSLKGSHRKANSWFERSQLREVKKISCQALDNVLERLDKKREYHFLKIDAQGAEYEILLGAENLLDTTCQGIQLELFEYPILKGIKLLPEVEQYLKGFGFQLVKRLPSGATFDAAYDCLFIKKELNQPGELIREVYNL